MFIIEKHNEERPYQYGIFLTESKAIAQLEYLKTESDEYFIKEIPIQEFPLYVIDYFNRSEFATKPEIIRFIDHCVRMKVYNRLKDEDDQLCIIERFDIEFAYKFNEQYLNMHWHCTKDFFKWYKKYRKKIIRHI